MKSYFYRVLRKNPYVYVAIGDSVVEGIGATNSNRSFASVIASYLKQYKKSIQYHNLGKRGAPTKDIITNQLDTAIALNPDLITISAGVNDIRILSTPWQFKKDLKTLIDRLEQETHAEIVINNIPDFSVTPLIPRYSKRIVRFIIRRFNNAMGDVVASSRVTLVDLFNLTSVFGKQYPEAIADDKFHPSDFGYAIWSSAMLHFIDEIIKKS